MPASPPTSPIGEISKRCGKGAPQSGAPFLFLPENRQLFIFPLAVVEHMAEAGRIPAQRLAKRVRVDDAEGDRLPKLRQAVMQRI